MPRATDNHIVAHHQRGSTAKCLQLNGTVLHGVKDFHVEHAKAFACRNMVLHDVVITLQSTYHEELCDELPSPEDSIVRANLEEALGPQWAGVTLPDAVREAVLRINALASIEHHLALVSESASHVYSETERANARLLMRLIDRTKKGLD